MRFPVQHYMLQGGSHVAAGYDATHHNGLTGAGSTHVIPAALAQYVGRHYTTQALPAHGYSIPGSTWLPQYVMQPAPPHHLAQIDVRHPVFTYPPSGARIRYPGGGGPVRTGNEPKNVDFPLRRRRPPVYRRWRENKFHMSSSC